MNKKVKAVVLGATVLGVSGLSVNSSFAASSQTDTVNITIDTACSVSRTTGSGTYSATLTPGAAANTNVGTSVFNIICNSPDGWKLQAVAAGTGTTNTDLTSTVGTIPTNTTGDSFWAYKVTGTGATGATSWAKVPATATTVASGSSVTAGNAITVVYEAKAGAAQPAGTYTGKVTYTVSAGAA